MCMTKNHMNMDSHSYRNVHDKNPYNKKWIVIRTEMCMTNTHTARKWIVIRTEMRMTKLLESTNTAPSNLKYNISMKCTVFTYHLA